MKGQHPGEIRVSGGWLGVVLMAVVLVVGAILVAFVLGFCGTSG